MSTVESSRLARSVTGRDHVRGSADAPVTLVQYGDLECPYCGDVHPILRRIQNRVGRRLRVVFRHFPLTEQHVHAEVAAEAVEAAGAQGDEQFWRMHDMIYERQNSPTLGVLEDYARELGLDVEQFSRDVDEHSHEERIRDDFASGVRSGVNGTPTLFINGERYDGPLEFNSLLTTIATAGGFVDIQRSIDTESRKLRETIDRSRRGAPAAGETVRDRFSVDEIFQRITATANDEIDRSARLLFFSGLAAGFSLGATFFGQAVMTTAYPNDPVGLGNLLYPLGFVFIVLGGYQLYTENTLTPVTLVLTRLTSIPRLLRLWGIVIVANVVGAVVIAFVFARTAIFAPTVAQTAYGFGRHVLSISPSTLFFKAVITGALVATMVWLTHAVRDSTTRFLVVYLTIFLIPAGGLVHCITGSCEVLYVVFEGGADLSTWLFHFFVPVVLGNTLGGVLFVAMVSYSMTADRRFPDRDHRQLELGWLEWALGSYGHDLIRGHNSGPDREESGEKKV